MEREVNEAIVCLLLKLGMYVLPSLLQKGCTSFLPLIALFSFIRENWYFMVFDTVYII